MLTREKIYYFAYDVFLQNGKVIHGSGTGSCKGKPEIEKWIKQIETINFNKGNKAESIQILSCIEVDKDFIND